MGLIHIIHLRATILIGLIGALTFASSPALWAQQPETSKPIQTMNPKSLIESLTGEWKGTVKTWFRPEVLNDESEVAGKFEKVYGGKFLRHTYTGSMLKKLRTGEELVAYNSVGKVWEVAWVDTFHMSYAILFSTGKGTENGFSVLGSYDTGPKTPKWGWRTVYQLIDKDNLTITSYNITPEGKEMKGVEIIYKRVKSLGVHD